MSNKILHYLLFFLYKSCITGFCSRESDLLLLQGEQNREIFGKNRSFFETVFDQPGYSATLLPHSGNFLKAPLLKAIME